MRVLQSRSCVSIAFKLAIIIIEEAKWDGASVSVMEPLHVNDNDGNERIVVQGERVVHRGHQAGHAGHGHGIHGDHEFINLTVMHSVLLSTVYFLSGYGRTVANLIYEIRGSGDLLRLDYSCNFMYLNEVGLVEDCVITDC